MQSPDSTGQTQATTPAAAASPKRRRSKSPKPRTPAAAATPDETVQDATLLAYGPPAATPPQPPPRALVLALSAFQMAATILSAAFATCAALLTSTTFGYLLAFAPLPDDLWGLKACAALMRIGSLFFLTLCVDSESDKPAFLLLAGLARLVTTTFVELSVLFAQPAFATIAGGVFRIGDASRAATVRASRAAWLATHDPSADLLILGLALALHRADRRKWVSSKARPYSRIFLSAVAKAAKAICAAALFPRLKGYVVYMLTNHDPTDAFAYLPTALFHSRHEFALFKWSVDSSLALSLIVVGDLCMANPFLPPQVGAGGALALGVGLLLSGLTPTAGFLLSATAWIAHAACHLLLHASYKQSDLTLSGALGNVSVTGGFIGKLPTGGAKLQIRIAGWKKPIYRPFDWVAKCALFVLLLCVYPESSYAAASFVASSSMVVLGVIGDGLVELLHELVY